MPLDVTGDKSTLVQVMLGAVRQQAITWANVDPDLCCHMMALGHNELTYIPAWVNNMPIKVWGRNSDNFKNK